MILLALFAALQLPPTVDAGSKLFAKSCATGYCHGAEGAAARGPRLRDRQFDRDYLIRVTRDGIPRSAMPAWKERLTGDEIEAVVDYIVHLNGGKVGLAKSGSASSEGAHPGRAAFVLGCTACHIGKGLGLAAGPALTAQSSWPSQKNQVRNLKLKDGEEFPSWIVSTGKEVTVVLDLTEAPPIRRSLDTAEIVSQAASPWKHPAVDSADWGRIQAWLMLP